VEQGGHYLSLVHICDSDQTNQRIAVVLNV
jgi:hypothetical protein